MKIIYFGDLMGDLEEEAETLKFLLVKRGIHFSDFQIRENPKFFEEEYFDVLFFDWGGMSYGNSLMEHFIKYILSDAEEHPNRTYIMTSDMTRWACEDMLKTMPVDKKYHNVFPDLKRGIEYLKTLGEDKK